MPAAMPWLVVLLGYFLGSIPTAFIAGHLLKGTDIRQLGDGNVGARNAFYEIGAKTGIVVFFIDVGKGALAIIIAQTAELPLLAVLLTGVAAVAGHNWPVFIGFKGGRGEATTIGVLLSLITQPMLILAGPAFLTLILRRSVIWASVVLFVPLSLVCWLLGFPGSLIAYSIALPCLLGLTHFLKVRQPVAGRT